MTRPSSAMPALAGADVPGTSPPYLRGRWLIVARGVWLSVAALLIASFLLTLPLTFAQLERVCTGAACELRLRQEDLPVLAAWGLSPAVIAAYSTVLSGLVSLCWIVMGVLIFVRRSAEPHALFFSFCLLVFGGGPSLDLATVQPSWWLPITAYEYLFTTCSILLLYLFPTGQYVPCWTRWVVLAAILVYMPIQFFGDSLLSAAPDAVRNLVPLGGFVGAIVAQVYRYGWRSTPVERQQTKWVVLAMGLFVLLLFTAAPVTAGAATPLWVVLVFVTAFQLAILLIPLSIATSILRYRLWEIDALINKALVYGSLTGLLGALYAGLIIGLESLAGLFNSQGAQPVVLVISTLAIAVLVLPVRRRIQAIIDRRFYRKKYDAEQTLAAFSATLRQELDLEQISASLLAVVQETMQPEHVSLWLRQPAQQPQVWQPRTSGMLTSSPNPKTLAAGLEARMPRAGESASSAE